MKVANPLHYPLAVLVGGAVLVVGVRLARLPSGVVVPVAAATTLLGAAWRHGQQPEPLGLENRALEHDLQETRQQAVDLTRQAAVLQAEAQRVLTDAHQMDLLGIVQYACDRTHELPTKVDQLAQRLQGQDSLLSVADLQRQLRAAQRKQQQSKGLARDQWTKLATSLQRNIELAQQGSDVREAQVVNLSTLILDAAGVLQTLQNTLRTADLTNSTAAAEVRTLSDTFNHLQETMDILIAEG